MAKCNFKKFGKKAQIKSKAETKTKKVDDFKNKLDCCCKLKRQKKKLKKLKL